MSALAEVEGILSWLAERNGSDAWTPREMSRTIGELRGRLFILRTELRHGCDCVPLVQHSDHCSLTRRMAAHNAAVEAREGEA